MKRILLCIFVASTSMMYGLNVADIKKKINEKIVAANKTNFTPSAFIAWELDAYKQLKDLYAKSSPSAANISGSLKTATKKQLAQLTTGVPKLNVSSAELRTFLKGLNDGVRLIRDISSLSSSDVTAAQQQLIAVVNAAIATGGQTERVVSQEINERQKLLEQEALKIEQAKKEQEAEQEKEFALQEAAFKKREQELEQMEKALEAKAAAIKDAMAENRKKAKEIEKKLAESEAKLEQEEKEAEKAEDKEKEKELQDQQLVIEFTQEQVDNFFKKLDEEQKKELEQVEKDIAKQKKQVTFSQDVEVFWQKEKEQLNDTIQKAEEVQEEQDEELEEKTEKDIESFEQAAPVDKKQAYKDVISTINTIGNDAVNTIDTLNFFSEDEAIKEASYGFNMIKIRESLEKVGAAFLKILEDLSDDDKALYGSNFLHQQSSMYASLAALPYMYVQKALTLLSDEIKNLDIKNLEKLLKNLGAIFEGNVPHIIKFSGLNDIVEEGLYLTDSVSSKEKEDRKKIVARAQEKMKKAAINLTNVYREYLIKPLYEAYEEVKAKNNDESGDVDKVLELYNTIVNRYNNFVAIGFKNNLFTRKDVALKAPEGIISLVTFYSNAMTGAASGIDDAKNLAKDLFKIFTDEYNAVTKNLNSLSFDENSLNFKDGKEFENPIILIEAADQLYDSMENIKNENEALENIKNENEALAIVAKNGIALAQKALSLQPIWIKKYFDQALEVIKYESVTNIGADATQSKFKTFFRKNGKSLFDSKGLVASSSLVRASLNELNMNIKSLLDYILSDKFNINKAILYDEELMALRMKHFEHADEKALTAMKTSINKLFTFLTNDYFGKLAQDKANVINSDDLVDEINNVIEPVNDTIDLLNDFFKNLGKDLGFEINEIKRLNPNAINK